MDSADSCWGDRRFLWGNGGIGGKASRFGGKVLRIGGNVQSNGGKHVRIGGKPVDMINLGGN